jgi:hypothetical protein
MTNNNDSLNDCYFGNILICKLPKKLINDEDTNEDIQIKKIILSKLNPLNEEQFNKSIVIVNHIFNHYKFGSITSKSDYYIKKYNIKFPTSFTNILQYKSII